MVIPLQGNPAFKPPGSLEEDSFGGLLTLQFLLTNMDHKEKTEETIPKIEGNLKGAVHKRRHQSRGRGVCQKMILLDKLIW